MALSYPHVIKSGWGKWAPVQNYSIVLNWRKYVYVTGNTCNQGLHVIPKIQGFRVIPKLVSDYA